MVFLKVILEVFGGLLVKGSNKKTSTHNIENNNIVVIVYYNKQ